MFTEQEKERLVWLNTTLKDRVIDLNTHYVNDIIRPYVVTTHRTRALQEEAFKKGLSKAQFGQSPHNFYPSLAVDILPFNTATRKFVEGDEAIRHIISYVYIFLQEPGLITWGGLWINKLEPTDTPQVLFEKIRKRNAQKKFVDCPHFELVGWKAAVKP